MIKQSLTPKKNRWHSLFYVAPKESMDSILKQGILPPQQVEELISQNKLSKEVRGVSYGMDTSNFPEYVSLLTHEHSLKIIGEQLCNARTGNYFDPDFMAIGYDIDIAIMKDAQFVPEERVKKMHPDPYPGEVLYKGIIKPEHIVRYFAVRSWKL